MGFAVHSPACPILKQRAAVDGLVAAGKTYCSRKATLEILPTTESLTRNMTPLTCSPAIVRAEVR